MTTVLQNSHLTTIWQLGGSAATEQKPVGLPTATSVVNLNISHLPAPDQSRIWAFLEFMHEYSQTTWCLQSGENDADLWFVDGAHAFVPPLGTRTTPTVVHVVSDARHVPEAAEDPVLVRPLDMESFAALLIHLEKRIAPLSAHEAAG